MAEDQVKVTGERIPTRGAQVRLTGDGKAAAQGGFPGDIEGNTVIKRALEADGTIPDGNTVDGSTITGKPPADDVFETEDGVVPAEEGTTRVVVEPVAEPGPARKQAPTEPPAPAAPPSPVASQPAAKK